MTIDEAIKDIKENIQPFVGGLSLEMAIQALEENEEYPTKLIRMGIKDTFGLSGKANELMHYFNITAEDIINKIIK